MTTTQAVSTAVSITGLAVVAYVAYYAKKYGRDAVTPPESWLRARRECRDIDRELSKLLGHEGKR